MKYCKACRVQVCTPAFQCPLCGGALADDGTPCRPAYPPQHDAKGYHFVRRLLAFASALACVVCAAANLLLTPDVWWCLYVVTALGYLWISVPHMARRGGNAGGKTLMQVLCLSALAVLLDWEIGWRGWSVDFVLPVICCGGIVTVLVLILANRTNWAGYVLYQVVLAVIGFVPAVLYALGAARFLPGAVVPGMLAAVSLLALFLFGDRSIKSEFKRRLRF